MAPKAVVIELRPGIAQATLPDHRKAIPGVQYNVDWTTFKKITASALENTVQVVSVVTTGGVLWMTDNGNGIVDANNILSTVGTTPPSIQIGGQAFQGFDGTEYGSVTNNTGVITNSGQQLTLGQVALGTQDERWMLVQNIYEYDGTAYEIAAGDVCVWCNSFASGTATPSIGEQARTVTNQRPAYSTSPYAIQTFPTDNFAGVAVAAIPAGSYGWIQIEGECDVINTGTSTIAAGASLSVDESNAGKATTSSGLSTLSDTSIAQTLTITGATGGTFTLTQNGNTTGSITFSETVATLASNTQTALRALAGLSAATVTGTGSGPYVLTITLTGTDLPVTGDFADLTGTDVTADFSATSIIQTIQISSTVEGGTFGLAWGNYMTTDIAYDAEAVEILVALKQIPQFPTATTASGGPVNSEAVTITFPAGNTTPIGEIIDENLVFDASGQVFGTALAAQTGSSGSYTVEGYIRVNRGKKPQMRQSLTFSR